MEENWFGEILVLHLDTYYQEENDETIAKLQTILDRVGVKIETKNEKRVAYISQRKDYMEKKTRNAGRHRVMSNRMITLEEVEKLIAEKNAETVAKELGISRSTLFRKIKYAKEQNDLYLT
ncbi:hypothetical protein [Eubacterium ventriosum]|uniref:hypothetical protein n=1 Tax=Eubacterium ventriosum TaxID=39496 RepID=UPI003AB1D252